jgi:hypothetical protein
MVRHLLGRDMQMTPDSYRDSFARRLRVLFSPLRLILFLLSIAWLIAANVMFIGGGGKPGWLGLASVVPIIAWVAWEFATDARERTRDRRQ